MDATDLDEAIGIAPRIPMAGKGYEVVSKAVAAGGTTPNQSKDYGFMYQHGFQDLDGHLWELIYMDPSATSKD